MPDPTVETTLWQNQKTYKIFQFSRFNDFEEKNYRIILMSSVFKKTRMDKTTNKVGSICSTTACDLSGVNFIQKKLSKLEG